MIQKLAMVFAAMFILLGILGFVPSINPSGNLFGIFKVDGLHNIVHISSALLAIYAASQGPKAVNMYFRIIGLVYGLVAVMSLVQITALTMIINTNTATYILNATIAITAFAITLVVSKPKSKSE